MVVTQVPVAEWHSRLPGRTLGNAIRDRLVHYAYRFEPKVQRRFSVTYALHL